MDRYQEFDARLERAVADLDRRLIVARRRERRSMALLVLACVVSLAGWTPLSGQPQKTMEERIDDLEKRTGGVQIENGVTRLTAPLEIYDSKGRMIASFNESEYGGLLAVGGSERGYAIIGTNAQGAGLVKLLGANRRPSIVLGSTAEVEGRGLFLLDGGPNHALAALRVTPDALPRLDVGKADSGGIAAIVTEDRSGWFGVRRDNGEVGVIAGEAGSGRMGVHALGDKGSPAVSIYSDALGGNVRVHSPKGAPVGGLFSEEEGGALVLTAPEGGHSVVDLGVRNNGGSVRVFSTGGSDTRAALEADDKTGAVTAFANDGKPAATMTSRPGGSGYFQLLYNGITMVDAGMNTDQVGVVRAGPSSQKVVGVLAVPYRLVGRK